MIALGMARQGYDLQLTRYDARGWRATFYTTGMEHSITSATASARRWEDMIQSSKNTSTEPVRAYTTKQDCDRALTDALAEFKSSPVQIVTKDAKRQEASVKTGKTTISYRYVCLPDTIDPRGPKGK